MSDDINVQASSRSVFGKGASRRLRRENLVPAILYGADETPTAISLKHNEVTKHLSTEAFYSQLLSLSVDGGEPVRTLLRDVQRHPFRQQILHMDFQRVVAGAELQVTVAIHYLGEDDCPGVKSENGMVSHNDSDVTVACLPRNIPEYVEVDMSQMSVGDSAHLSDIKLPDDVRIVDLVEKGDDSDRAIASVMAQRVVVEEDDEAADDAPAAEGEADDKPSDDDAGDET